MTVEEAAGPPGPKALRLLCFVGAGFIFTIGINKWREIERKSVQQQQEIHHQERIFSSADVATKPIK